MAWPPLLVSVVATVFRPYEIDSNVLMMILELLAGGSKSLDGAPGHP